MDIIQIKIISHGKPHGSGGAEHKILYNYKSIKQIFDKDFEIRYLVF